MPRKPTPRTAEFPIHIVARSNNREWFFVSPEDCWEIIVREVIEAEKTFGFETHLILMMSNHYHWLLSTPLANLGEGMCRFQTNVSWSIARKADRINHVFGGRYKPSVITCAFHYANVYRYIAQNPTRAGICDRIEDYPFSSLVDARIKSWSSPGFDSEIPPADQVKEWLNKPPPDKANDYIKSALRRSVFKFPRLDPMKSRITGHEFL